MIEMVRIYSNGFLENVTIEELTPWSNFDEHVGVRTCGITDSLLL
jgi:hypothetical protein